MINFPNAPTPGQVYTAGGASWAWDGTKWTAASGGSTAYAPLASPVFTGDARAVTPATADNDTSIATTAYVKAQGYATSPVSVANGGTNKTSWTTGSVAFAASAAALGEDSANLFWDDTNNRLGLGITIPLAPLHERFDSQIAAIFERANATTKKTIISWKANGAATWELGPDLFSNNGQTFYLYDNVNAAVRWQIDTAGLFIHGAGLAVSGNATSNLEIASGYTLLYAPDGGSLNAGITCGNAANANIHLRNTTINFQNRTAAALFAVFDGTSTRNVSGAWATISDPSVKEDVVPYTRGLDAVLALEPVQFRYAPGTPFATEDAPSRPLFGLMADQVKPHVPEIVGQTEATVRGVEGVPLDTLEPGLLVFALINAVKELSAKVAALEGKPA